jgi:RHS repeat-associated protein
VTLGTALTAGYDGDGLRAWKNNGTTTTYFLYDGIQPVVELNSSGSVTATNTFGGHGLLSRNVSGTTTLYTFDSQGSVAQRLSTSGTLGSTDAYNAWGSRTSTGGGDVFTYGAQWGYYTDGETGLILCGHRYYDPARGRWLTRDPIGYVGGVDLYGYCRNEPVGFNDVNGHMVGVIVGGGIAIGTVILILVIAIIIIALLYYWCHFRPVIPPFPTLTCFLIEKVWMGPMGNTCFYDCPLGIMILPEAVFLGYECPATIGSII